MKKSDIQNFLKNNQSGNIILNNQKYVIYPEHIIEAVTRDYKDGRV